MSAPGEEVSLAVLVNCQVVDSTYKGRLSLRKGEGEGEGCSQRVVPSGGLKPLTLVLSLGQGGGETNTMGPTMGEHYRIALKSYSRLHGWCGMIRSIPPYEIP
jgi:hypothetical protein